MTQVFNPFKKDIQTISRFKSKQISIIFFFNNYYKVLHIKTQFVIFIFSSYLFRYRMLQQTSGLEDVGIVQWELCLCLLLAWTLVYLCIFKGVKSTGKVIKWWQQFEEIHVEVQHDNQYVFLFAGGVFHCYLPVYYPDCPADPLCTASWSLRRNQIFYFTPMGKVALSGGKMGLNITSYSAPGLK